MIEIQFNSDNDHFECHCNFKENTIIKQSSKLWKFDRDRKCWYTLSYNVAHQLIQDLEQFERNRRLEVDRLINNMIEYHIKFGD
jgi:hypothetical protein